MIRRGAPSPRRSDMSYRLEQILVLAARLRDAQWREATEEAYDHARELHALRRAFRALGGEAVMSGHERAQAERSARARLASDRIFAEAYAPVLQRAA